MELKYAYNTAKFIPGETPVYYSGPYWDDREIIAATRSLTEGKWISSGEKVKEFENKFAQEVFQSYAVMVNSGSSANLVMLAALKKYYSWNDGDEIIVSVVGFPTTIAPIIQNSLKPVFIDIEMKTLNFDLALIQEKITDKTKAIFLSPVLGNPPDMHELLRICKKNDIKLVLDCCDSLGTKWLDKYLSECAVASSFSFYPAHHISTGEGGMVTSDIEDIVTIARSMAWWGRDCYCIGAQNLLPCGMCKKRFSNWLPLYDDVVDHKYVFTSIGYNLKPLDLQGAIGLVQLKKIDEIHSRRKGSYLVLKKLFEKYIYQIYFPKVCYGSNVSWFGVPIVCIDKQLKTKLVNHLEKNKIQTRNYFAGNILLHPAYQHLGNYLDYPNANQVLDKVFFVGSSPHYNQEIFDYFEKVLMEFNNGED